MTVSAGTSTPPNTYVPITGTLAVRPAPAYVGQHYFATDQNGGTLYESLDGSTWTQLAPGVAQPAGLELGYAEITAAPANQTAAGYAARVDVTGLSVTFTALAGAGPVKIEFRAPGVDNLTATDGVLLYLAEDGTVVDAWIVDSGAAATVGQAAHYTRRPPLSAGAHTYKIQWAARTGGTAVMSAGTGLAGALGPASLQVVQC